VSTVADHSCVVLIQSRLSFISQLSTDVMSTCP